jgi:hypothetical protein
VTATHQDISGWFDEGLDKGATHMIVMCDTYEYFNFPMYIMPGESPREKFEEYVKSMGSAYCADECYSYSLSKEYQMRERRANHWK